MNNRTFDRLLASAGVGGCLGAAAFFLLCVAGWLTHVIHCLKTQEWILLLVGALGAPIGVIHGWGLWFGWWGA